MIDVSTVQTDIFGFNLLICSKKLDAYHIFIKDIINIYLDHPNNYQIFIRVDEKFKSFYQTMINDRITLLSDDNFPAIEKCVYINHNDYIFNFEQQEQLINNIKFSPNIIYIFVSSKIKLTTYTIYNIFKYYLHFEKKIGRWRSISSCRSIMMDHKFERRICRKYFSQNERKKRVKNPIKLYDYFLFMNLKTSNTRMGRINPVIFTPKIKPIAQNEHLTKTIVKYIYVDKPQFDTQSVIEI